MFDGCYELVGYFQVVVVVGQGFLCCFCGFVGKGVGVVFVGVDDDVQFGDVGGVGGGGVYVWL